MALTKNEAAFICFFLADLSDQYGNAGCNDFAAENTEENRAMIEAAEKAAGVPKDIATGNSKILTYDYMLVEYLKQRLMDEFGLKKQDLPKNSL